MNDRADARAILVTGIYGVGKSTLVETIAGELEEKRTRYAALDLDWLAWFDPGLPGHDAGWPVALENVDAVVGNYYKTGVRSFVIGGSILTRTETDELRSAAGMPLVVVRLTLPIDEIERRLSSAVTAGRLDDLRVARTWHAEGKGEGIGDLVLVNDRPIAEVARDVLAFVGW
jgi:energy-coupling factor transporter ATP-binding protein EcfA2